MLTRFKVVNESVRLEDDMPNFVLFHFIPYNKCYCN